MSRRRRRRARIRPYASLGIHGPRIGCGFWLVALAAAAALAIGAMW